MAEEYEDKHKSPWPLLTLLGLIFLPGAIAAFGLWTLFRYRKQQVSVVATVGMIIGLAGLISLIASGSMIVEAFQHLDAFLDYLPAFVIAWVGLSVIIGVPFGCIFVWWEARRMRKNPYLKQLEGSWRYKFEYARTPLQKLHRKTNIKKLRNALLVEEQKAPMGLDEKTDEVVFRYDTEARKHTFMTGASGSGKALHANTWIPTKRGFVRASRVKVGDIFFDEQGKATRVSAVYQPKTPDHFEITLSNGEIVRTCGDHLWTVRKVAGNGTAFTLSTREIAKASAKYYISSLKNPVEGTEKIQLNTRLLGEWLASGAGDDGFIRLRDKVSRELVSQKDSFVDDLKQLGWLNNKGERVKLDSNTLLANVESRERILEAATRVAGAHTFDGQTKLTITDRSAAEFLRQLVFSLGMQPSLLHVVDGSYSFKFKNTNAKVQNNGVFTLTVGSVNRKKAPLRGPIYFSEVKAIEDNPDDYFCFTVDSPSHLFLFGKSFTPTHNTITMQSLISADIENGKTVVVVDFKRSPKFASKLAAWAEDNDREFYHFVNGDSEEYDIPRSKGQCFYDPLKSGTPTSKADMVLGMREYDSNAAVYKSAMQQLLQVLFGMLKFADHDVAKQIDWNHGGLYQLASVMSGNGFGELAAGCTVELSPDSPRKKWPYMKPGAGGLAGAQEVFMNTPIAKNAIELAEAMRAKGPLTQARDELQGQMRTIIASEYGQWMKTGNTNEDREIDLFELTKEDGNVILFSLNSDSEPEFAQYVGSMIFADLTNISALRRNAGSDNQVNIYVDEFQAVPPTAVTSLLEKSRESKMALTIAQQSFDQVVASAKTAGEAYLNSILDTCSNFIAHAGATEDSATRLSKLLGKQFVTVYSKTNDNDSSFLSTNRNKSLDSKVAAREEERWIYGPSEFMKLSSPDPANDFKSSAVWVTKTSADPKYSKKGGASARTVWMVPPERVLLEYYEGKIIEPKARPMRNPPVAVSQNDEYNRVQAIADINFDDDEELEIPAPLHSDDDYEPYENEQEDEDWGMYEVPEGTPEEEEVPEAAPAIPVTPKRPANRAEMAVSDSVEDLFRSSTPAAPAPSKTLVEPSKPKPQGARGLPTRSGLPSARPGLPSRPGAAPVAKSASKDEDMALPDLNDMQLPEL